MSCAFLKDYWWDKEVHFFDKVIPLTVGGSINQIWKVACLNTNSQEPLLFEWYINMWMKSSVRVCKNKLNSCLQGMEAAAAWT